MENELATTLTLEHLLEEVVSDERSVGVTLYRLAQILFFFKHSAQPLGQLTRAALVLTALQLTGYFGSRMARHATDAAPVDSCVDLERRWTHLSRLLLAQLVPRRRHASLLGALHLGTIASHELFF
jgi:hypothetical protein